SRDHGSVSSELTRRILFGVIAGPIVVGILLVGDAALAGLIAIASALAAWEFYRIARAGGLDPLDNAGIVIAGLIPLVVHARYLGLYNPDRTPGPASLVALVLVGLFTAVIWLRGVDGKPLGAVAATALGAAYTGGLLSFGYAIRNHEYAFAPATLRLGSWTPTVPSGGLLVLLPVLLTWASDIGAFTVGRAMGRRKLIPAVSPGKTVEGAIGGLVACMLLAWVYAQFVLRPAAHLGFRWSPFGALAFGALASVAAQLGDLTESLMKREGGVKDSSHLIPGHGGVLDRLDSLFFVLPVSYVALSAMLRYAP
ncbi:MAG: phosphatidate cytidylyltransferase, partial [Gemmatimonadaceae bacterium]